MKTLRQFAVLGVALLSTTGLVQPAAAATMQEAIAKAIASHPEVLAAEKDQAAIGHTIEKAKSGYRPTLDLTAGTGWENSTNPSTRFRSGRGPGDKPSRDLWRNEARLSGRQMLFDGFQTKSRVAQANNRFESAGFHVADVRNQVALRAVEAYLNVLRSRELVALAETNMELHGKYVNKIQARTNSGRATGADTRQAQGRMAQAQANVEGAKGDLKQAEADYLEAVGEMPASPAKDATPFSNVPADTAAAIQRAMTNSPVIASAMADIKAANAELQEAKCVFCPRLDAEAGVSRNLNLDGVQGVNNDMYAMLMARYNLYRGGFDVAQRAERTERVKEAQDLLEKERRQVERAVIRAYADLDSSKARLEPLSKHVEAATSTRNAYVAQFDLGQRSLLDLLDSEVELFNAKADLINGKYDLDASAYAVLAHMGDLAPAAATVVSSK